MTPGKAFPTYGCVGGRLRLWHSMSISSSPLPPSLPLPLDTTLRHLCPSISCLWLQLTYFQLSRSCYYQLRQLRTVYRSLFVAESEANVMCHDTTAALVHAFATSRLDHCCSVLVGLSLTLTARLDSPSFCCPPHWGVPKYASISGYMRDTLHWLPIQQRIFIELLC